MKHTYAKWLYIAVCLTLCAGMCLSFWYTGGFLPRSYGFDTADEENFVMVEADAFQSLLPKNVTKIVFSDRISPYAAEVTDFSARRCKGVVGWYEGDKYIISTRTKGQKVIFHPESQGLFAGLSSLGEIAFDMADTSRVTDFMRFFYNCTALSRVDISSFRFDSAIRTRSMFMNCTSLSSVTVGEVDTSTIRDTAFMFSGTVALEQIDLSHCDFSAVICSTAMFQSCGAKVILLPDSLGVLGAMFLNHAAAYGGDTFTLPISAKELSGAHLFYNFGTDAFCAFVVPDGNPYFKTVDGVLYSADGTRLLALPKGKRFEDGVFEIPEGVTLLGELCFSRNPYAETVLLPNSYRVCLYKEQNHADFSDISGAGNKNVGNSLNIAIYTYSGVKAFAVRDDNAFYIAVDGVLYEKDEGGTPRTLVAVPVGFVGTLDVPDGVSEWNEDALFEISSADFASLTAIHIPASLTLIAESQISKINSLDIAVTVDEGNPVYTVDGEGKLCKRS